MINNVIKATIIKGKYKGEDVLTPRIPIIPTDLPYDFKRLQFPVCLAFAMTANKSQGSRWKFAESTFCFAYGLLYFACSRIGKSPSLFIYALQNKTKNIVYRKV
ncbi:hypothetical protein GWI33_008761 [Rhynchophorus ferrugineus]|uniref:ATP-dependent DNA helicase n=1 Tax=Rhynchophorus ferrugineus TaxID=354439 RepID=A0A834MFQ4_RHYFE|nr:hypothetical protein GWI33_008761 [Rhynchophorus ferrugineus]